MSHVRSDPRPITSSLFLTLVVVTLGIALNWHPLTSYTEPVPVTSEHAFKSLEVAFNRARFGVISHLSTFSLVRNGEAGKPDAVAQPLADLLARQDVSVEDYQSSLAPFLQTENSLMLLDLLALKVLPDLSLEQMIHFHTWIKVAAFVVFTFLLLRVGASPLLSLGVFSVAMLVASKLNRDFPIGGHALLLSGLLLLIALFGLAVSFGLYRRLLTGTLTLAALGWYGGFFYHLRTSYLPILGFLLLAYLTIAGRDLLWQRAGRRRRLALQLAVPLLAFVVGFEVFSFTFIQPIIDVTRDYPQDSAYHPVALPVVLSLAQPECELSRREGIIYEDLVGLTLARRIDPAINYLDARFDRALLVYYAKLWAFYPREMGRVYLHKFHLVGRDYCKTFEDWYLNYPSLRRSAYEKLTAPLRRVNDGFAYLAWAGCLAIVGLFGGRTLNPGAAYTLMAVGIVGVLLLIESGVVRTLFALPYHAYIVFFLLASVLLVGQLALDAAAALLAWLTRRRRTTAPAPALES